MHMADDPNQHIKMDDVEELLPEDVPELAEEISELLKDPRCDGFDGLTVKIERKPN
jgi:hypothetical protein